MNTWHEDIAEMHEKFEFHPSVIELNNDQLKQLLDFRLKFLDEELNETKDQRDNPEEVVDGLIDLIVVAIGTLDLFQINPQKAWNAVHEANMAKERGIKEGRPNPFGFPDLMKPEGWKAPSHEGNHGILPK